MTDIILTVKQQILFISHIPSLDMPYFTAKLTRKPGTCDRYGRLGGFV